MRLYQSNKPGDRNQRVTCLRCGKWRTLHEIKADLNGPAFVAYFCAEGDCTPHDARAARDLYIRLGYKEVEVEGEWYWRK